MQLNEVFSTIEEGPKPQIEQLRNILAGQQAGPIKFSDGTMRVDMYSASAVVQVYDAVSSETQQKIDGMLATKLGFMKLADFAFSKTNKSMSTEGKSENRDLWDRIKSKGVVPNIDKEKYTDLSDEGLEGPFRMKNGQVLYYDPKEGKYYNRDTDMYVDYDDYKKMDEQGVAAGIPTSSLTSRYMDDPNHPSYKSTTPPKKEKTLQDILKDNDFAALQIWARNNSNNPLVKGASAAGDAAANNIKQQLGLAGKMSYEIPADVMMDKINPVITKAMFDYLRTHAQQGVAEGLGEKAKQVDEVDYKKYLKVSQEKRPVTMRTVDATLSAEKEGNPNPARKLRNTNAARKFAQGRLTKKYMAAQPARPFHVYEPGRTYVGDSVEHDGPVIDGALEALARHVKEGVPLCDSLFRYMSEGYFDVFVKARKLREAGALPQLDWESEEMLASNIGQKVKLKGLGEVYLDVPYMEESADEGTIAQMSDEDLADYIGVSVAKVKADRDAAEEIANEITRGRAEESISEAEYAGRDVDLNKPKRGGSKKYFVYVKNPQTDRVKKIEFGDVTGLRTKSNNPDRARSFAARHNCEKKNDKTKAGYWACRLPRYGLVKGGKWW